MSRPNSYAGSFLHVLSLGGHWTSLPAHQELHPDDCEAPAFDFTQAAGMTKEEDQDALLQIGVTETGDYIVDL